MEQEKYMITEQDDQKKSAINKMAEEFNNFEIPYKIKKTNLLEKVGLPTPETDYFKIEELNILKNKILEELQLHDSPLIVRLACIPDKFSMPFFYIEKNMKNSEINKIVDDIYSLSQKDSTIKYLILQKTTPLESAKDKISGRILFEKGEMMPIQEVLEIYKGDRSTGILNNVDINNPNFQRFIKKAGEFMKPEKKLSDDTSIRENEIREIYNLLSSYREKIETIVDVITKNQNEFADNMAISLEFSYRDSKIIFSDIDF
ncbi:MAG: hypothetical protein U9Q69_01790 [Nanoarchaeota archaeon]|nr:hypothetical protein [Nanoarchaeota archaeon]